MVRGSVQLLFQEDCADKDDVDYLVAVWLSRRLEGHLMVNEVVDCPVHVHGEP